MCYIRLMAYNWQLADWPRFTYALGGVESDLLAFAEKAGRVHGMLAALPEGVEIDAVVRLMVAEAIKTSEIEGEYLSHQDVLSSIKNQLGLNTPPERVKDSISDGIGKLMVSVRRSWNEPLSHEMLFEWHRLLMQGSRDVSAGQWRTHEEPMQVVSGSVGKSRIHYEAPPSDRVPAEMSAFIRWFNQSRAEIPHAPVRAGLAHLYFESIHPFEDGNGRIGRALSEKALSQGLGRPALLSLSRTIEANKKAYYAALKDAQRSNEVTQWITYFAATTLEAQLAAERQVEFSLRVARFLDRYRPALSARRLKVVERIVDAGPQGFLGGMNARKYQSLTGVSKATATRDLQEMVALGVLIAEGAGRSVSYRLNLQGSGSGTPAAF